MLITFKIIDKSQIETVIPLVEKLNDHKISHEILKMRFEDMISQNYECAVVYDNDILIGVCGLWYSTRHYSGKSVEVDHVYIEDGYRNKGIGQQFFKWILKSASN